MTWLIWSRRLIMVLILGAVGGVQAVAGQFEDAKVAYEKNDFDSAIRILRPLATQGDRNSQALLGKVLDIKETAAEAIEAYAGIAGVPAAQTLPEVMKWYRLAAEQGDADAQVGIGEGFEHGRGVERNYAKAMEWYQKSANQGNGTGQFLVGRMYERGTGVTQDYAEAEKWLRMAANQGFQSAQKELDALLAKGRSSAPASAPPPQLVAVPAASPLGEVFSPGILGNRVPYLEKLIGPARRVMQIPPGEWRRYTVNGCSFTVEAANDEVRAVEIPLGPQCGLDPNILLGTKNLPNVPTFGEVEDAIRMRNNALTSDSFGKYFSDCLNSCGNAADPSIFLHWIEGRMQQNMQIRLGAKQVSSDAIAAGHALATKIAASAGIDEYKTADALNCSDRYDTLARTVMRDVRLSEVKIGYDLVDQYLRRSCDRLNNNYSKSDAPPQRIGAGAKSDLTQAKKSIVDAGGGTLLRGSEDHPLPQAPIASAQAAFPPPQIASASPTPSAAAPRFALAPLTLRFQNALQRPDDIAVIIGNADYSKQGHDIPDARTAYADAESMRRYALDGLGVREGNVIFLKDATGIQLAEVFGNAQDHRGKLFNWVKPGKSRVFVYYIGHGAPGNAEGRAMLVPSDASAGQIALSGYPLDLLYANLGKLPAENVTVVLDACFSGASPAGSVVGKALPIGITPKSAHVPPNITVISAAAADQMANWEQDDSHALFTEYFLKGMSGEADKPPYGNGDGKVTLDELDRYLKETLSYVARRYYGRDQTAQIVRGGQ